jgi:integrase
MVGKNAGAKLTAKMIDAMNTPATIPDGGGLYLQIKASGDGVAKSWLYRYQINGRRRWYGLGGYPTVSASKARQERDRLRRLVKDGKDPLADREATEAAQAAEQAKAEQEARRSAATFATVAAEFIESKEAGWRNPKHRQQWRNTLRDYAQPVIGSKPVADVSTEDVLAILRPIWLAKPETAKRVQGRIERVLDYARAMKLREGENPARWRGHLDNILPARSDVRRVQHQRALPWQQAPALAAELQKADAPGARALLLTLLCATRTTETLQAQWSEFDLDAGLWTIPGERMKAGKPHRIPLPAAAVVILRQQEVLRRNEWVFPAQSQRSGKSLSNLAMVKVLERNGWLAHTTVHGLRSTFRDWISEQTNYPDRLAEMALAHQLGDKVEAAYRRTDQLEHRRNMMDAWASYVLGGTATNVVQMHREAKA